MDASYSIRECGGAKWKTEKKEMEMKSGGIW